MLHTVRAKRTGGAWVSALAGLGFLGLLVTIAIMVYMFSKETDAVFTPGTGTIPAKEQAKKLMDNINVRNADVDRRIAQEASQGAVATPVAAPATRPAATPVAAATPAPAGGPAAGGAAAAGAPSGGQVIGPISPVSPMAPIQEGSGPNLKPVKNSANGVNDAVNDRNKELERAIENGGN
jgi:hypothetical protein